jgi:hypothetical protein
LSFSFSVLTSEFEFAISLDEDLEVAWPSAPKDQLIILDGKEPKHGSGASVLSAVTVPSQHYLGSAVVDQKIFTTSGIGTTRWVAII